MHHPDLSRDTCHQYGISALDPRTSFQEETVGGVAKCRLFSKATAFQSFRHVFNNSQS